MADSVRDDFFASLLPCSYDGVPFVFESASELGGHRATGREILHADEQIVSNVGPKQATYNVRGYIAAREVPDPGTGDVVVERTYAEHRRALRAAFRDPRPKTFVHPIDGAVTGLVAVSWAIDEAQNEWGVGRVSVEFVRDTRRATPVEEVGLASLVSERAEVAKASTLDSLAERWGVDPAVVGSFEDGLTRARAAFESMQEVANEAELLTDALDAVSGAVSEGVAAAATLVTLPARLASDIGGALSVLASALPTAAVAFEGMILGFGFGEVDFAVDIDAPSARGRRRNRDAINATMNSLYLVEAYRAAAGLDLSTLDEIARVEAVLGAQFDAIVDAGTGAPEALDSLENLRTAFASYLDRARLAARRTVESRTAPTTPRTLSFALYGDDALARTLAGLNGAYPYDLVEGDVTVLSP